MSKKVVVGILIFLIIFSSGCLLQDPSKSPLYSVLPKLILDYDVDDDLTRLWVRSALGDFKYENITIEASYQNETKVASDDNTYGNFLIVQFKIFDLNILVNSEDKVFSFTCKVEIDSFEEDLLTITTYDEITDEELEELVQFDDLPYRKVLEEVEEE
jgi:hypothetical protein